ncbi:MAG: radical SAM protein [Bacteroidota bacterium]
MNRNNKYQYLWVDEFIKNVKPYIFVRTEDNLLIKRPNNATKLNENGAKILKYLLDGGNIKTLIKTAGKEKETEILNFIIGVREYLKGNLDEFTLNPAVEIKAFNMNFSQFPVLSELAITYSCNLKCKFCYAGCNCTSNPCGTDAELTEKQFKEVINKIYTQAKVPSISFTGGEPCLKKDLLLSLISYAKKLEMRVNLITNGSLIDKNYAHDLKNAGLDSVQVSLEGVNEKTADILTGVEGSYNKTIYGIKYLSAQGIHTHTNTTITKININEVTEFPAFIKSEFGFNKFSMNLIIPAGSGIVYDDLIVPYSEAGKTIEEIIHESEKQNVEFMWYSPVPLCMFNSVLHGLGNKGCSACDGLISVAPNGDVLPCASYDDPVGNMLKTDFSDIWQSDKAKKYRNKELAHSYCKDCDHFHICNGACPLYWRKCGFGELENIIKVKQTL